MRTFLIWILVSASQLFAGSTASISGTCTQTTGPFPSPTMPLPPNTVVDTQTVSATVSLPQQFPTLPMCNTFDPPNNGRVVVYPNPSVLGSFAQISPTVSQFGLSLRNIGDTSPYYFFNSTMASFGHIDFTGIVIGGTGHGFIKGASSYTSDGSGLVNSSLTASWATYIVNSPTPTLYSFPFEFGVPFTWTLDGSIFLSCCGLNDFYVFHFISVVTGITDDAGNTLPGAQFVQTPEPSYTFPIFVIGLVGVVARKRLGAFR